MAYMMTGNRYTVEARDRDGWYDFGHFKTADEARAEAKRFFDPAVIAAKHVKIIDSENMLEVDI